jgi:hypothetical protein
MRLLRQVIGIIVLALFSLAISPARADFITWNYGTISGANGTFGEDKSYGGYIATTTGADGLFINNDAHLPISGPQFTAIGSVQGLRGWDISGQALPPGGVMSFGPPNSTYWLTLEIEDGPAVAKNIFPANNFFQFTGYFQGTLGGSTPVNVFTGATTQTQFIGLDWYRVQIRYQDGISSGGLYEGSFLLDVTVNPSPEPSTLLLLALGSGCIAIVGSRRLGRKRLS